MAIDNTIKELKNIDRDDILNALGLQSRRSSVDYVLPALTLFGAGLATGIGIGMLLAPKSGRKLRRELGRTVDSVRDRAREAIEEVARN